MGNKVYCGLDFHKNVSELCIMDQEGKVLDRVRLAAEKLVTYLSNKPQYHIGVESSGGVFDITSKLEKRAGTNKAVVALAHKNARICFALLRDATSFGLRVTKDEKSVA